MASSSRVFAQLEGEYSELLKEVQVNQNTRVNATAARLLSFADKYKEVSDATGVPWEVIGVIHYRESNCDFGTHLHNGDTLRKRTTHVPAGRPLKGTPPFTWVESAIDAIKYDKLDKVTDWTMERMCYELEKFNGFGYRRESIDIPSPYLWSGTDHYQIGKFESDGHYNRSLKDAQLGVIPILLVLFKKDLKKTITQVEKKEIVDASRKLTLMQRVRNAIAAVVAAVAGLDYWDLISKVKQFATDHAGILLVGGAASIWLIFKLLEGWSIQDYKEGRYTPSKEDE